MSTLAEEADKVHETREAILRLMGGNSSNAAIHISGGGAVAVIVGLVAVVCLIAASALAYVSWQQAQLTERQTTEMRSRLEMAEAKLILLEGRQRRSESK